MKKIIYFLFFLIITSTHAFADRNPSILITEQMENDNQACARTPSKTIACATYHQTTTYTCGPAAAMTLLRFYGKLSSGDMNKTTELRIANEMGAVPGDGVTQSQLESWLSSQGFSTDSGRYVTSDMIIKNIDKRILTIISYNKHWIIAKGYNATDIIFSDSCCGVSIIPKDVIDSIWQSNNIGGRACNRSGNFGEYIIATPH
jgi:hypothetical protein